MMIVMGYASPSLIEFDNLQKNFLTIIFLESSTTNLNLTLSKIFKTGKL